MKEIIGLIPAGGSASRLGTIPCSKEIFPLGFEGTGDQRRPKAVSQYLLEKYRAAGATKIQFVLRQGKWDIPAYYGDGAQLGLTISYLMLRHLYGVPYTLDQAYPFVKEARVMLGFPDMLYEPEDCFATLLAQQTAQNADLVLGLYEVNDRVLASRSDMVRWQSETGVIEAMEIKSPTTTLTHSWINAVWGPAFTEFLHQYIQQDLPQREADPTLPEIQLGNIFVAAMEAGLKVRAHLFAGETFLDVGTLPSLEQGWQQQLN